MAGLADFERDRVPHAERSIWFRVLAYARPYAGLVATALLLTLFASGAEYGRAYLLKLLIDDIALPQGALLSGSELGDWLPELPFLGDGSDAAEPGARDIDLDPAQRAELAGRIQTNLLQILLLAAIIALALPLFGFLREYVAAYTLGRISVDMNRDACGKLLVLPLRFHHEQRRGDVFARVASDLKVAHGVLQMLFSDVAQAALSILMGVTFLVVVSWQLSLALLISLPLIFVVVSSFGSRIRRSATRRQEQVGEVTQSMLNILEGIAVIKAFGAEEAEHRAYGREQRKLFRRSMKVVKNRILARSLTELVNQVLTLVGLCIGGYLLLRGIWDVSFGDLAAFFLISSLIYRPVKKLAKGWVRVMDASSGAQRFLEVMDAPVEIRDAPDAVELPRVSRSVAMKDVSFAYSELPVLRDVSFEARAGEVVAIVGRSGAGKTTLVNLLMRFYDPQSGAVEFDGIDLRQVTRSSLLDQIGIVTQEPFLFDGSIRENLLYGRPDASEGELRAVARAAYVEEFVQELPAGYDTDVGQSGAQLSGGQRQRITIGRALLKDPTILILDEATSSLDSQSERSVHAALDALLTGDRTVFVIAHRLSTVRRADRILVIEDGRITQQGSHEELVASGGLYRDLLRLQNSPELVTP